MSTYNSILARSALDISNDKAQFLCHKVTLFFLIPTWPSFIKLVIFCDVVIYKKYVFDPWGSQNVFLIYLIFVQGS